MSRLALALTTALFAGLPGSAGWALSPDAHAGAGPRSSSAPPAAKGEQADTPQAEPPESKPGQAEPPDRDPQDPPPSPPVRGYVSKGIYSRFCVGVGLHIGVNAITAKRPLLGGLSAHFRASGILGLSLEYDFNRVGEEPSPEQLLSSAKYLHFLPNLRVSAVIVPYRWRMLGPFVLVGMGFDTGAKDERSTNIQFGLGLEGTFWRHRLAVVGEVRAFMPLPSDVERHRERVQISAGTASTDSGQYYNLKNALFTLSIRYYY